MPATNRFSGRQDGGHCKICSQHAIGGLKGWLKVINKASLKGTIFAGGTMEDGTIEGHPELEEAEAMGRNV